MRSESSDLTTRARIREAAIAVFGEQGFGTGVRAVAAAAGVSAGLVIHHFGSKDGLRAACDEYVAESIRAVKSESLRHPSPSGLLAALADIESFAPHMAYLMRSFQSGGPLAAALFQHMVDNAEQYLAEGVEAGTIRPSRDPKARARYLGTVGAGGFLMFLLLRESAGGSLDYRAALREYADEMMLPSVEIYTEGLLTDSMMLDTLVAERNGKETP